MTSLLQSFQRSICRRVFLDFAGDSDTLLISGTGRGGTTWAQELLNYDNSFRVMFEPFYPHKVALLQQWKYKQYLCAEDSRTAQYIHDATTILSGNIRNKWIDRYNRCLVSRRRMVKDIRTNLLLGWLHHNFPELRIVLLIRNPFAVSASRCSLGWEAQTDVYFQQQELIDTHLNGTKELRTLATSEFLQHLLGWCIETVVPLRELYPGDAYVCFYEDLLVHPKESIVSLCDFSRVQANERLFDKADTPSAQSRRAGKSRATPRAVSSWRRDTPASEIDKGKKILSVFGLDKLYGDDDLPLQNGNSLLSSFAI